MGLRSPCWAEQKAMNGMARPFPFFDARTLCYIGACIPRRQQRDYHYHLPSIIIRESERL
jgi:hypothetical protein